MDSDNFWGLFVIALAILTIIFLIFITVVATTTIYVGTTFDNKQVECVYATTNKGGVITGTTRDNRVIYLKEYKVIRIWDK